MATTTTLTKGSVSVEFKLSCADTGADKGIKVEADDALNPDCLKYGELFHFKVYSWGLPRGFTIYTSDNSISIV
ncbi:hypothetical protein MBAV_000121, partial [Candidatus Magnetobacterium bavaricum]